ncbi:MAG: DUF3883 domain-containing protein [Acidimicrobiaceae bacterium]|nr:DUF3883 domain-containing protein [Acidimicrobiaceae bacterium]MYE08829.1 DUF3883 domain-containing protein [Acidimicrobiaceae bacterium]MYI35109.1 DUF3883 domain-containing protein [Acidimicrobiaceae bacterium]
MAGEIVERIVEQNLGVYRASSSRLQEDVSQEAQVASDYRGRLVYELLQNADDAMESQATEADRVVFVVTDDAVWMANSGRPLTDADVQGLCGLGASSKVDAAGTKRASIGHKGLGFKSVLEITDSPAVYSRTLSFRLGASEAWPHVRALWDELDLRRPSEVPAMRFPSLIGEADDEGRWPALRDRGLNTAFQFLFREDLASDQRKALTDLLLGLPLTTVLFLKHLESVQVQVEQTERSELREWTVSRTIRRDGEWVAVTGLGDSGLYRVTVSSSAGESATFYIAHDARVPIGSNREGLTGPAWQGVDLTEVSIAVLADEPDDGMPEEWRHFHVFLPTEERCPYPMLVNGAFATDLSRQHIRVRAESGDYNSHLVREAARLFVEQMLPELRRESVGRVLSALDRGDDPGGGDAADLLHECLVKELAGEPLISTESGQVRPIDACALPSPLLEMDGELFRSVLTADAMWGEAEFPVAEFCRGRWARVAADHGALQLTPSECLTALGKLADPQRAAIREHESGGYEVDPVLELSALLWERADAAERSDVEAAARLEPIFPVHRDDDRSVSRVALGDDTAFYPPQSAKRDFPLRGLRFMCHSICWGALNKSERTSMLGDQMRVWSALFDIKEFRFQEVMQASVLPALGLNPTEEELAWRAELQTRESLAAICQLAGSFTKPDRPLRYQRLQSDRAIFNLSRLPVPCINGEGGEHWVPAYQAYFGRSWLDDASFEHVVDVLPDDAPINVHFVEGPEKFVGLLDSVEEASTITTESDDDDEVDLNEDVDRSLETTEFERWLNFLSWIGVNRSLRLVHFHDVEDRDSGWLTTKGLQQPKGWAFRDLGETWIDYCGELEARLADRPDHDAVVPYLYEVHDLDHALPLIEAAEQDASAEIASRFFEHLILHWATYAPLADAQVALVKDWRWPAARSKPQRATPEEITSIGDNLWLFRLRTRGICPTSRGPRSPKVTWRRTSELERRFSSARGRRDASDLVPVLKQSSARPANALRAFCERLGIRTEVSPSTFAVADADLLCRQIERLYSNAAVGSAALRHVIKPAYRSMFELLSGKAGTVGVPPLGDSPLLAERADGHQFLPAREVLFASTPGIKERSGLAGRVPVFVLEAEAPTLAPLRSVFGCRDLERVLEWAPDPGECPFDSSELVEAREGLRELAAPLLARIRAERTNPRDLPNLIDFVERIEPVDTLDVTCTLDEVPLERQPGHGYYVRPRTASQDFLGFVVWTGQPWPPGPDTAQSLAMALADALGVNLVETLLAFINSDDRQRRQLLRIAGASGHYHDVRAELDEGSVEPPPGRYDGDGGDAEPTPAPEPPRSREGIPSGPGAPPPAAPPVPLHVFDVLRLDGEPLIVTGERVDSSQPDQTRSSNGPSGPGSPKGTAAGPSVKAPAGTDLSALDDLGMKIAVTYEVRRFERDGMPVITITDGEPDGITDPRIHNTLVVEVHTPAAIARAEALSETVRRVMKDLEAHGISRVHPGFDLLTIRDGEIDRMIELKSSGVDARVQAMSWNEWKSASHSDLRKRFWLYLVGNLRADLDHASPYVRAINDPFGSLASETVEDQQLKRAVQLRVREFATAEHLDLTVTHPTESLQPSS